MEHNHTITKKFNSLRDHRHYRLVLLVLSGLCLILAVWLGAERVAAPSFVRADDFVAYWAAWRINLSGGNPYDPEQLLLLQRAIDATEVEAVMIWSPPWMLVMAMPFGWLDYPLSRTLWLLLSIIIVFVCANQLWLLYGGSRDTRWIGWIVGFTFAPVLDGLQKGQTSVLLLLGVVGFLYFIQRRNGWLAGICLALLGVKPHTLYLYVLAALFWSVSRRQWSVLAGSALTLLAATAIAWVINPGVIGQYLEAVSNYPPSGLATPTLGGISRFLFGPQRFWIQFVPPAIGLVWLIYYWLQRRKVWDWLAQAPLLILVSNVTTAYGWTWDQIPGLVAVIQIANLLIPLRREFKTGAVFAAYLVIDCLALFIRGNQLWKFWFAPALLVDYLVSMKLLRTRKSKR